MRHYKIKHAQQVFSGSTAPKLECNVIDIGDAVKPKRPEIEKRPRNNSPYTSHGKPKATPGDPIRDMAISKRQKSSCSTTVRLDASGFVTTCSSPSAFQRDSVVAT